METASPRPKEAYLCYHQIGPVDTGYRYHLTSELFETHLQCAHALARDGSEPQVTVKFTFDDGDVSNIRQALPSMKAHGFTGTFFVTAGWTDSSPSSMTFEELKELVSQGHQVQSHSWSHPMLTRCSDRELEFELQHSKEVLEDRLQIHVDAISFPGGRWDQRVLRAARKAGYRRAFTSDPWQRTRTIEEIEVVDRSMVCRNMSCSDVKKLLRPSGLTLGKQFLVQQLRTAGRTLLGERLYHQLWLLASRHDSQRDAGANHVSSHARDAK